MMVYDVFLRMTSYSLEYSVINCVICWEKRSLLGSVLRKGQLFTHPEEKGEEKVFDFRRRRSEKIWILGYVKNRCEALWYIYFWLLMMIMMDVLLDCLIWCDDEENIDLDGGKTIEEHFSSKGWRMLMFGMTIGSVRFLRTWGTLIPFEADGDDDERWGIPFLNSYSSQSSVVKLSNFFILLFLFSLMGFLFLGLSSDFFSMIMKWEERRRENYVIISRFLSLIWWEDMRKFFFLFLVPLSSFFVSSCDLLLSGVVILTALSWKIKRRRREKEITVSKSLMI